MSDMGKLYVVATPIGNLNDISKRGIDTLRDVDMILCEDTRNSIKLLNRYDIKNKLVSYHKFNEREKCSKIIKELEDKDIALISDAGTPCISDPGYVLIKSCREHNIEVISVGGISAVITGLSVSGLKCDSFTFYGFFPRENKDKISLINDINMSKVNTYVFYESPKRILSTLEYLYSSLGNIMVCLFSDLTKLYERTYYGDIEKVIREVKDNDKSNLGEYTLVIEKEYVKSKEDDLSIESKLVDIMVKEGVSLKDSVNILNEREKSICKKNIYNASLNLKNVLK